MPSVHERWQGRRNSLSQTGEPLSAALPGTLVMSATGSSFQTSQGSSDVPSSASTIPSQPSLSSSPPTATSTSLIPSQSSDTSGTGSSTAPLPSSSTQVLSGSGSSSTSAPSRSPSPSSSAAGPGYSRHFTSKLSSHTTTFGTALEPANASQSSSAVVPTTANTALSSNASTTVSSAALAQHSNANGTRTAIIAGAVGGVGGVILLVMFGLFFCVRRRRRKHAKAKMIDWQSVRPSVLRSPSNSPIPRTPKSSSHSIHSNSPLSPSLSQMTHSSSQYATAQENTYSPTRLGTARTNISPLLIVQSPSKSEESYHGHDEEYDPFADSLSMARMRPQIAAASPTIRVSDATLVDQAWAAKGLAQKTGGAAGLSNGAFRESPDELLMPPPPLNPVHGRPNRLSNDSLQPGLQEEESAYSGVAM
ncbi:hypothetical protein PHLGIDRAFT_31628 [Phlebiopsis gigantea 11061_1 CR5-6]|uniref:Mid2 domain-containing protein n=1 Tax=Phlebiopsis gigantea (strain 11061_1 CR5-6) TaxID=745531 RepID=A0A0C3S2H6_PHLG1|nr:hypothetical protein PHLGIDRAFT_31628 [Phlebiopsis gigantea 11061_1 CR5-6]